MHRRPPRARERVGHRGKELSERARARAHQGKEARERPRPLPLEVVALARSQQEKAEKEKARGRLPRRLVVAKVPLRRMVSFSSERIPLER